MTEKRVRVVTKGMSSPVRIVTNGPSDPVTVVTCGPSNPVRIVTNGCSDPVRGQFTPPPPPPPPFSCPGNLVVNGGFDDASGWMLFPGWSIAGGVAVGLSSSGEIRQSVLTVGKTYHIELDVVVTSGDLDIYAGGTFYAISTTGHYEIDLLCTTIGRFSICGYDSIGSFTGTIDNVCVVEV